MTSIDPRKKQAGTIERPIDMSSENAKKCHDGDKTQIRRVIPFDDPERWKFNRYTTSLKGKLSAEFYESDPRHESKDYGKWTATCPYGKVGDRLWVREPHTLLNHSDGEHVSIYLLSSNARHEGQPTRSPICMPRWGCKTLLEITNIKVQRLQDINPDECFKEGVYDLPERVALSPGNRYSVSNAESAIEKFKITWNSTNSKESWNKNPWTWVVSFRKL